MPMASEAFAGRSSVQRRSGQLGIPHVPTSIHEILEPRRAALLVWDMQIGIAPQAHNAATLPATVGSLLVAARRHDVRVIWSKHVWPAYEHMPLATLRSLMRHQRVSDPAALSPMYQAGSPDVEILPSLRPEAGEMVIEKATASFFVGTPLDMWLRVWERTTLVLTGVATESGIDLTARHADALGYFVVVAEDAVGGRSAERHALTLEQLRSFADVLPTKDIIASWTR
jgi:nicotinamidase-related amidase